MTILSVISFLRHTVWYTYRVKLKSRPTNMFSSQKIHFFLVFQESSPSISPLLTHNFKGPPISLGPSDPLSQKLPNGRNFGNVTQKVGLKSGFTELFYSGTLPWNILQKSKWLGFWTLLSWTYFLWRQSYNNFDEKIKLTVGKSQKNLIFRQWLDFPNNQG